MDDFLINSPSREVVTKDRLCLYKNQDCILGSSPETYYRNDKMAFDVYYTQDNRPVAYLVAHCPAYYVDGFYFPKVLALGHSIVLHTGPNDSPRAKKLKVLYEDKIIKFVTIDYISFVMAVKNPKERVDVI